MESREAARLQQKEKVVKYDTSAPRESTLLFGQSMKQHNEGNLKKSILGSNSP